MWIKKLLGFAGIVAISATIKPSFSYLQNSYNDKFKFQENAKSNMIDPSRVTGSTGNKMLDTTTPVYVKPVWRFVEQFEKYAPEICEFEHPNLLKVHGYMSVPRNYLSGLAPQLFEVSERCDMNFEEWLSKSAKWASSSSSSSSSSWPETREKEKEKEGKKRHEEFLLKRNLAFCIDVAQGLNHLHQKNYIHGSVKPDNVLLKNPYNTLMMFNQFTRALLSDTETWRPFGKGEVFSSYPFQAPELAVKRYEDGRKSLDNSDDSNKSDELKGSKDNPFEQFTLMKKAIPRQYSDTPASDVYSFGAFLARTFFFPAHDTVYLGHYIEDKQFGQFLSNNKHLNLIKPIDRTMWVESTMEARVENQETKERLVSLITRCIDLEPSKRPTISEVLETLNAMNEVPK